jgi:ATP-dependent RNA helicase SUPV3L1/SUV3
LLADEQLSRDLRAGVEARLARWLRDRMVLKLASLLALNDGIAVKAGTLDALPAIARGIAFQLCEHLGTLDAATVTLPSDMRIIVRALRPYGIQIGRRSIYMPQLLRPEAASLLALLRGVALNLDRMPAPPQPGLTSFAVDQSANIDMLQAAGFHVVAGRAIRVDMLERLEDELDRGVAEGITADALFPKLVSLLGSDRATLELVLKELGWRVVEVANAEAQPTTVWRHKRSRPGTPKRGKKMERRVPPVNINSPFASLAKLKTRGR